MNRIILVLILMLCLYPSIGFSHGSGLPIPHSIINIEGERNTKIPFDINLKGFSVQGLDLQVMDLGQSESGHISFLNKGESTNSSKIDWVTLQDSSILLNSSKDKVLKGHVIIPEGAKGRHLVVVIAKRKSKKHAFLLKIQVPDENQPWLRNATKFEGFTFRKVDSGWTFDVVMGIQSDVEGRLLTELQIRSMDKEIVHRISLKTLYAWESNQSQSRVYPGAKVKLTGFLKQELNEGDYDIRIRSRFNGSGQSIVRQSIVLTDDANLNRRPKLALK